MIETVMIALFVVIPLALAVLFVVCLCRYLSAKKRNKQMPGSVLPETLSARKLYAILSGVIAGVFWAAVIGIIALFAMAIAYM